MSRTTTDSAVGMEPQSGGMRQENSAVEAIGRLEELARAATLRHASGNWRADDYNSTWVWGDSLKGGDTHIADVRGWGYLTGRGHGALALPEDEALAAQRNVQRYIAAANPQAILSLIEERRALREALEPFAKDHACDGHETVRLHDMQVDVAVRWSSVERARAALDRRAGT